MKMKKGLYFIIITGIMLAMTFSSAFSADKGNFSITPKLNKGEKWRIGYYEGGEYIDYQQTFLSTVKGLMELGWIEKTEIPPQKGEQTKDIWNWLATGGVKSKYIQFVKNAHYTADWDDKKGEEIAARVIDRLNRKKDIDLMIAMGTFAAKGIANDKHKTPTMVLSTSDPIAAKIINCIEDSGCNNVHARVDPFRYERQIRIFHDIIGFQKLGVAYENTIEGRSYAAFDKVKQVAEELGFEIVSCYTSDQVNAVETYKKCVNELSKKVDAIYVTEQGAFDDSKRIPEIINVINSNKIPTFAQAGSYLVRYGMLMSISQAGFKYVGRFHAETFAKVFNGAKPRQLDQVFEDPPKIAINIKTAEIIGFDPPVDVLGAADEIFEEIEKP